LPEEIMSDMPSSGATPPPDALQADVQQVQLVYGAAQSYDLGDVKAAKEFITACVRTVRHCPEYTRYRDFLVDNMDMGRCSILSGLSDEESVAAALELHHCPLALYDVCELVLGQMIFDRARVTTFAVANRVMAYHWKGMVGLIPLTKTIHEAVHSGQVHVDPRSIFGNWAGLIEENRRGLAEHLVDKLKAVSSSWSSEEAREQNARALTVGLQRWNELPPTAAGLLSGPQLPSEEGL
jgi:hypothetical protein